MKNSVSILEKLTPLKAKVLQVKTDYSNLVVTAETLKDAEKALETVQGTRIDLDKYRKDITSFFEGEKKKAQTDIDDNIAIIKPLELKLKSDIITHYDDVAWEKALKDNNVKAYEAYLKKFNDPKLECKGKYIAQANEYIAAYHALLKQQSENFGELCKHCNTAQYKTSQDAIAAKEKLQNLTLNFEVFGANLEQAQAVKTNQLPAFDERIQELETAEETARQLEAARLENERLERRNAERSEDEMKAEREELLRKKDALDAREKKIDEDLEVLVQLKEEQLKEVTQSIAPAQITEKASVEAPLSDKQLNRMLIEKGKVLDYLNDRLRNLLFQDDIIKSAFENEIIESEDVKNVLDQLLVFKIAA